MQHSTLMKTHSYKKQMINEKTDPVVASYGMPAPTNANTASRLAQIDDMKLFFVTATQPWDHNRPLKRYPLPGGETISCVYWDRLFFITGTDIVRSLTFRFHAFGRPVTNAKKFEEGVFSDLRNLKPGHDARLEEPKSDLLDMLYKNNCIRTQKKQKVFFWFSVPHDRLFLDALERDLKREKMGLEPTTKAVAEPAASLSLDSTQELFDQLRKNISQSSVAPTQQDERPPVPNPSLSLNSIPQVTDHSFLEQGHWTNSTGWEDRSEQSKRLRVNSVPSSMGQKQQHQLKQHRASYLTSRSTDEFLDDYMAHGVNQLEIRPSKKPNPSKSLDAIRKTKTIFGNLSLFDGSPTYKLRRRRASSVTTLQTYGVRRDKCNRAPTAAAASRLAMAALKAGWQQDYYCPLCRHLFKRPEHLERHMKTLHLFVCSLCGKQFGESESLAQHQLAHQTLQQFEPMLDDDDSSHDEQLQHQYPSVFQPQLGQAVLSHHHQEESPQSGSRSSGWLCPSGMSSSSSRSSTLSPIQTDMFYRKVDLASSSSSPATFPTLLSPFKLNPFPQDELEQMMGLNPMQETFDLNMDSTMLFTNDYPYTPFGTSNDMNLFGA